MISQKRTESCLRKTRRHKTQVFESDRKIDDRVIAVDTDDDFVRDILDAAHDLLSLDEVLQNFVVILCQINDFLVARFLTLLGGQQSLLDFAVINFAVFDFLLDNSYAARAEPVAQKLFLLVAYVRGCLVDRALNLFSDERPEVMPVLFAVTDLKAFNRILKVAPLRVLNDKLLLGRQRNDSELLHTQLLLNKRII